MIQHRTTIKLTKINSSFTLEGSSISAIRTGLRIPQLGIFLDAGIHFKTIPQLILITHTHIDHIRELPFLLPNKNTNIKVVVPKQSAPFVKKYINSIHEVSLNIPNFVFNKYDLIEANPFQVIDLKLKSNYIRIETYPMHHGIPCFGYGIYQLRNKLKKEFVGKTGKEIAELKKSGVEITNIQPFPLLFFSGDTDKTILHTLPYHKFKYFIIECTFLLQQDKKQLKTKRHLHYDDLIPYFEKFINTTFILIHFSKKYNKDDLDDFQKEHTYSNVIFLY